MSDVAVQLNCPNTAGFFRVTKVTVADANALTKGTVMVLSSDANTATAHSGPNQIPVGILLADKVANDGTTSVAVALDGDWDMVADGSITLGYPVVLGAAVNDVKEMAATMISNMFLSQVLGVCKETASDNEVVRITVRLG